MELGHQAQLSGEGTLSSVYLEICGQCLFAGKSESLPLGVLEATVAKGYVLEVAGEWAAGLGLRTGQAPGCNLAADSRGSEVARPWGGPGRSHQLAGWTQISVLSLELGFYI